MAVGRHTLRELPAGRRSLGPIRSPFEHEPPEDPHGLRAKRPANIFGVPGPRRPLDDLNSSSWPTARPTPVRRRSAAPVVARMAGAVAEVATVALVSVYVVMTALRTPSRPGEVFGVEQIVAAARPDVASLGGTWPQRVFGAVGAAWVGPTGALERYATAHFAVREAMAVTAIAGILLLWLLVRRLRLAVPSRIAVVVLAGALPTSTTLLIEIRPGVPAAVALLLATALVAGTRIGAAQRVLALLALVAAALLVPAALPALLAAIAVLLAQGDLAANLDRAPRVALAGLLGCAALVALAIEVGGPASMDPWLQSASPAPGPVPELNELPLLLAGGVLTVAALGQRWLRAPAVVVLLLLVSAAVVEPSRADLVAMALPITAVVAVAGAEDRLVALWLARTRTLRRRPLDDGLRAVAALACAVLTLGVLASLASQPTVTPAAPAVREVAGWFASEVPGTPPLLVDDSLWPDLLNVGVPDERLRMLSRATRDEPVLWRIIGGSVDTTGAVSAGWLPYAAFGDGGGRVTVLARLDLTTAEYDARAAAERAARVRTGQALATNPGLRLTESATTALIAGNVDERIMYTLTVLTGQRHVLTIADFPAVPGELPGGPPLRRVLLSAVNGRPATDPDSTALIQTWYESQLGAYRPAEVALTDGGLLIRYTVLAPPSSTPK